MSMVGNTYNWVNIYIRVPSRKELLELFSLSRTWIQELSSQLNTYYILPRPEENPIFRLRLATSSEKIAKQLEESIVEKIQRARSAGPTIGEPIIRRDENLQRFTSVQLSFLQKITDFLFELTEKGLDEQSYREVVNDLFRDDFNCFHLLSMSLCLRPVEEGRASLNYFMGFGISRIGQQPLFT